MTRNKYREFALLVGLVTIVLVLGAIVARDLGSAAEGVSHLHTRLSRGLDVITELQFQMQEVRRILLYALHTTDANRQLEYAEQSRLADTEVQRLLNDRDRLASPPSMSLMRSVEEAWTRYRVVRDEVIGLILEGSSKDAVDLDEHEGLARFNEVRQAIDALKARFASDAEAEVTAAKARANASTARLTVLVLASLAGALVGIHLVSRRAALEALLRSEAHKGSILQAVPDPIISTDAEGHIIEINDAGERVFGRTRAEALGTRVDEMLLSPQRRSEIAGLLARSGEPLPAAAPRLHTFGARRDGSEFPIELAAVTHQVGNDRIWTIHVSDMTERRLAEKALQDSKEGAEVAARAKSEFLATMSHELRTPLNSVIGITDLLETADLPARQQRMVDMLRSSATALLGLVSDVLDYSRIDQGLMELTPVDFVVRDCIEDALSTVTQAAARKRLQVGYLIDVTVPVKVRADEARVRQVLLNLLSNAVKFTDAGEISVQVGAERTADGAVCLTINVQDTGCGIPEQLQPMLFQRFVQLDATPTRRHGGAGLGLSISRRLSELLGGSLTVTSQQGAGAIFRFTFLAQPFAESARDELRGSLSGVKVLVSLAPGIVGEQVHAMLSSWDVHALAAAEDAANLSPPSDHRVAWIVDSDAQGGALLEAARLRRHEWGLGHVPFIIVARPAPAAPAATHADDYVVAAPVSARRLHEALRAVVLDRAVVDVRSPVRRSVPLGRPLAILLAEDDEANRRVQQLMLEELGCVADEASDGLAAAERASRRDYDVILMDVHMPGIDGLEATRRIRRRHTAKRPLIVALTADAGPAEEERCLAAGMDVYHAKPVRLETLASVLRSVSASQSLRRD
jgi:PAS domain S-box-containing protein